MRSLKRLKLKTKKVVLKSVRLIYVGFVSNLRIKVWQNSTKTSLHFPLKVLPFDIVVNDETRNLSIAQKDIDKAINTRRENKILHQKKKQT